MRFLAHFRVFLHSDHGGSLVELTLVTPLLLLLVAGIVDIGHAFYVGLEVANAAHAGAEYGSLNHSNTAGITTAALQSAPDLTNLTVIAPAWGCECGDGTKFSPACSTTPSCTPSGNVVSRVSVTTSTVYHTLFPWPTIPSTLTLSRSATMRGMYP